jgi:predicted N-formylglutamate amidohydrolase
MKCLISCEHASRRVPRKFVALFSGHEGVLATHRAYDQGAATLARRLAKRFACEVHLGNISRLLIDLNRSPTNRRSLFSVYSRRLSKKERAVLLAGYHNRYRKKVMEQLTAWINGGDPVLHLSVHSFTPVLNGRPRNVDIGLLYDPARRNEGEICSHIARFLKEGTVALRVRKNYPYLGKSDGFTAFLRKKYGPAVYAGIELEINEDLLVSAGRKARMAEKRLGDAVADILQAGKFSTATQKQMRNKENYGIFMNAQPGIDHLEQAK